MSSKNILQTQVTFPNHPRFVSELSVSKRKMLVGWCPRRSHGGVAVRWLRITRGTPRGRSPESPGDGSGGLRQIRTQAAADLPHMWAW